MSRRNYSKYSEKNNVVEEVTEIDEIVEADAIIENAEPEIELVEETVETVTLPEIVVGTVVDCSKLNVRANPNATAAVVGVLDAKSEVKIDAAQSTNDWVKVCTATGIEGYCMRKFVSANL